MANVIFKVGTKALFDALEQKDTNTLYWLEDVQELYKGNLLFATGKAASQTAAGLMSAEDKVKLDNLSAGTVAGLTPVDATIVIADGEEGTKTIGVQVSKVEGNTIEIEDDGLYVAKDNTEYAIEKLGDAAEGYSATYRLKKTVDGSSSYVGAEINIPKDLVVQSGSVKTVTEDDQPYVGAKVGDTYIELILNDAEASHIYIPTSGLIDTSDFVVREIVNDDGGTALIFNESTTDPATEVTVSGVDEFAKGDVVTYNAKEYVYDGATWRELGDESSFAVKGSIKDTDIAADAAIAQSKIAGLETALAAKATPADITTAIEGLDVADEAVSGQVVSAVVETDGKIAVSRRALVADDIPTLAIAKVEGLQDALDGKAVESDITDAIAALDVEDSAVDGQVVSAVAETDGKITVTRRALVANDIPELAQNKITGLTTALAGKQDNITFETAYDASTNKAATMTDVDAAETAAKEYTDTALTWGSF